MLIAECVFSAGTSDALTIKCGDTGTTTHILGNGSNLSVPTTLTGTLSVGTTEKSGSKVKPSKAKVNKRRSGRPKMYLTEEDRIVARRKGQRERYKRKARNTRDGPPALLAIVKRIMSRMCKALNKWSGKRIGIMEQLQEQRKELERGKDRLDVLRYFRSMEITYAKILGEVNAWPPRVPTVESAKVTMKSIREGLEELYWEQIGAWRDLGECNKVHGLGNVLSIFPDMQKTLTEASDDINNWVSQSMNVDSGQKISQDFLDLSRKSSNSNV
jgi:hypothetical protein